MVRQGYEITRHANADTICDMREQHSHLCAAATRKTVMMNQEEEEEGSWLRSSSTIASCKRRYKSTYQSAGAGANRGIQQSHLPLPTLCTRAPESAHLIILAERRAAQPTC